MPDRGPPRPPTAAGVRPQLVLASASPARLSLLRAAGLRPAVVPSGVGEAGIDGLTAADAARVLAERKAGAVADRLLADVVVGNPPAAVHSAVVLGCDSLFAIDGDIRGKPESVGEARAWWRSQRGKRGTLVSGHCLVSVPDRRRVSATAETDVHFGEPTDAEIEAYLATGEPLQVAGAATIDGYGAPFVDRIDGDHGTVLGTSLPLLRRMLAELGIAITDLWSLS